MKAKCSSYCDFLNHDNHGMPVCADENWSSVAFWPNKVTCTEPTPLLDFGHIEDILGATPAAEAEELACDLADSCIDLLEFDAMLAMVTPATPLVRYSADVLMETDGGRVSSTMILGDDADLIGAAAYTALSCADDACPFYLAQFDLEAVNKVDVAAEWDSEELEKSITGITIGLTRPALGMWLPNSGDIIFPPDSLAIRVTADIDGETNEYGENGSYDNVYRLQDYVFGTLDNGVLYLSHEGEDILGTWSVEAFFIPE